MRTALAPFPFLRLKGLKMKLKFTVPCGRCGKGISEGYSDSLFGPLICGQCVLSDPKMVAKLDRKGREALRIPPPKKN